MTTKIGLPFKKQYWFGQPFGNPAPMYTNLGLKAHNGCDFACPTGTEIISVLDGVVEYAGEDTSAGKGVYVISQLDGKSYRFIYWHFCEFRVSVGQQVKQGDVLGISDNTGLSTGPHLHFGMKPVELKNGWWQDTEHDNGFNGAIDPFSFLPSVLLPITIRKGMEGCWVSLIQTYMNKLNNANLIVDGKYGVKTELAVKAFQSINGLKADGKFGSLSANKLLSLI